MIMKLYPTELVFFVDNSLRQLSLLSNVRISSNKSYSFSTDFSLSLLEPKTPANLESRVKNAFNFDAECS